MAKKRRKASPAGKRTSARELRTFDKLPILILPSIGDAEAKPKYRSLHIPDWVLGANDETSMLVGQLWDASAGMQEIKDLLAKAVRKLHDDNLWLFRDAVTESFENVQFDAKGLLEGSHSKFTQVDKSWSKLLGTQVQGSRVLFLGAPPAHDLCGVFESHGWHSSHIQEGTTEFQSFLRSSERQDRPRRLSRVVDGPQFDVVYVGNCFATLWGLPGQGSDMTAGKAYFSPPLSPCLSAPQTASAESNLQNFRDALCVAIGHLRAAGALIVKWQGLPYHPVLLFLAAQLRTAFKRVHLVPSEDAESFVVHVLATGHDWGEEEDFNSGHARLRYFLNSSQRTGGCDGAVSWCLPQRMLMEEYNAGRQSYEEMWHLLAQRISRLLNEHLPTHTQEEQPQQLDQTFASNFSGGDTMRDFFRRSRRAEQELKLPSLAEN